MLFHSVGYNDDGIGAKTPPVFENCTFENVHITGKCYDHDGKYQYMNSIEMVGFEKAGYELKNILLKDITVGIEGEERQQTFVLKACENITISNLRCIG